MAVVESLTKTVGGTSALLDHFGDMVGVFCFYLWRSHKVYKSPPILTSLGAWGKCKCKGGMINCRSFWGHGQSVIVGVNLFGGMGSVVM